MDGTYETKMNCMMRLMLWCTLGSACNRQRLHMSEEMLDVVEYGDDVAVELREQSKHACCGQAQEGAAPRTKDKGVVRRP